MSTANNDRHPGWFTNILLGIVGFFLSLTFFFVVGLSKDMNQFLIREAARVERDKNFEGRLITTETRLDNYLQLKANGKQP